MQSCFAHHDADVIPSAVVQVAELLRLAGLRAAALHGGLSQGEREGALRDFTKGDVLVLVATDVASRGLDIKGIGHVVNLDLPKTFEDYVHRIGEVFDQSIANLLYDISALYDGLLWHLALVTWVSMDMTEEMQE